MSGLIRQQLVFVSSAWCCAWCGSPLSRHGVMFHQDDCRWIEWLMEPEDAVKETT